MCRTRTGLWPSFSFDRGSKLIVGLKQQYPLECAVHFNLGLLLALLWFWLMYVYNIYTILYILLIYIIYIYCVCVSMAILAASIYSKIGVRPHTPSAGVCSFWRYKDAIEQRDHTNLL